MLKKITFHLTVDDLERQVFLFFVLHILSTLFQGLSAMRNLLGCTQLSLYFINKQSPLLCLISVSWFLLLSATHIIIFYFCPFKLYIWSFLFLYMKHPLEISLLIFMNRCINLYRLCKLSIIIVAAEVEFWFLSFLQ